MTHYIITRYESGWGSGPCSGIQQPDEIQVMGSSRTESGARRIQKKLGGKIRRADGPFRRYEQNEFLRYA